PDLERPFRIPVNLRVGGAQLPVTAIIGFLATVAVWVDVVITKPAGRNLGFVWMGVGLLCYVAYRRQQRIAPTTHVEIERVPMPEFRPLAIRKILVPTLGGPYTENIQIACQLAKQHGAAVTALYVIEIPTTLPLDTFLPDRFATGEAALKRAQAIGREYELAVTTQLLQARSAADSILDVSREGGYDLIVMGAAMKRGAPTPTLGSTVETVLRNAPCRVWLYRTPLK
ncbi:MAG: universal stress protein, partial [Candidatus Omnitrophica bacterium]|nr:universal stress protein [Candidatus Omnitrophota bacterium]